VDCNEASGGIIVKAVTALREALSLVWLAEHMGFEGCGIKRSGRAASSFPVFGHWGGQWDGPLCFFQHMRPHTLPSRLGGPLGF